MAYENQPLHTSESEFEPDLALPLHSKLLRTPPLITAGCWFDGVAADASPYLLDEPVQVER